MTDSTDDPFTNADRAERLHAALERYNDDWGVEVNLIDMLTDARHWCDKHGLSFAEVDRIAYQHYIAELAEERRRV